MQPARIFNGICPVPVAAALALLLAVPVTLGQLVAVEWDEGRLYNVSTTDASLTLIGGTGLVGLGALEFNPSDGFLYGLTTGEQAALYRIGISPAADEILSVVSVGELGVYVFEGGLAFAPDGTAYVVSGGITTSTLLTLDLDTGVAAVVNVLDGRHDIGGLGWRSDGLLVGLDATDNALATIDPVTVALGLADDDGVPDAWPIMGSVGGMALLGEAAFFATGGPLAVTPGSNGLYMFDPFNGDPFLIGGFDGTVTGIGISGLAIIPEPATLGLVFIGCLAVLRRRAN